MTYHRSPLAGHFSHQPPWGPEGGAWWRYDQGWTPNIQGPWNAGYPGATPWSPSFPVVIRPQTPVLLSRQAIETPTQAPLPTWAKVLNWVKENPMWAAGAVMVAALALQSRGMIRNAKRPVLHAEQCEGCGETVTRRIDKPFEGEVLCAACKRKGQRSKKPGGYEAALARGRAAAAAVVATCGDCHGSGLTATGKPCFCPLGDSRRKNAKKADDGRYLYVTDCVGSTYEDICELTQNEQSVSLATFRKAIGAAQWRDLTASLGYDRGFPISKDWHVGYYKGTYRGVPAYFLRHSRIEHIFTLDGRQGPSAAQS